MANLRRSVWVRSEFKALHCWPQAPEKVGFLKNLHRHTFIVEVEISITHNDREIEFFLLQEDVNKALNTLPDQETKLKGLKVLGRMSCEDIGEHVASEILSKYPGRDLVVSVSEDGEVGARLHYD